MSVDRALPEVNNWPPVASKQRDIPTFTHHDLDFSRLVARLSSYGTFPDSFHVRNTLISALSSAKLWTSWTPDMDPWEHLFEYLGPTSRVVAFGQVPLDVLTPAAARRRRGSRTYAKNNPAWGIVITAMRWRTRDGKQPPRIQVWISNGGTLHERQSLAYWVTSTWLVSFCTETRHRQVIFSGIDIELGEELKVVSPFVKVEWENPCLVYFRNAEKQGWLMNQYSVPDEYQVGAIGDEHIDLVYRTNKLSFPHDMVRERLHLSVMISKNGVPLGWAYGHEDMTIGSLHVLPEYRRKNSVGSSVIVSLESKLVFAQRQALWRAGVVESQIVQDERYGIAPYCGMIEVGNVASRGLSHYLNGTEVSPNTWMGVKVEIPAFASL